VKNGKAVSSQKPINAGLR